MTTRISLKNSRRFRPAYKKLVSLRENVQNRQKILKFKKKKWAKLINYYTKKFQKYRKAKQKDQNKYLITKFPNNKHLSYKKRFKNVLQKTKKLNQYFGGLPKKKFKGIIKRSLSFKNHKRLHFLIHFEKRLDVSLYRAHFCESIRHAQQLILHSKVKINNMIKNKKSYLLKRGDLISINLKDSFLVRKIVRYYKNQMTRVTPKHFIINFKTLQIIIGDINETYFASTAPFNFNTEMVLDYKNL